MNLSAIAMLRQSSSVPLCNRVGWTHISGYELGEEYRSKVPLSRPIILLRRGPILPN